VASETKTNEAWNRILEAHPDIVTTVSEGGVYEITASEIKKFREPRLMTKHDTSKVVPEPLRKHGINVLPISRSAYVLGDFELFQPFPDVSDLRPSLRALPDFETLKADSITSEANAINALIASGILDEFLGCENTVETFNGRMGTGNFDFSVDRKSGKPARIQVHGAQLEIDGGFENEEAVIIMEAKNVRHDDFHVRQLYYPYRKYRAFINKPIRLVFSQYTDMTYYLYEYEFTNPSDYSSLNLLQKSAYTFEDTRITTSELWQVWQSTEVKSKDNQNQTTVPFIQADRFDRVVSLMERLSGAINNTMTTDEVTQFMGTTQRQAAYYPAAGEYLGLFDRERGRITLTSKGKQIVKFGRRERQLALVKLMFEHEIFHKLFESFYKSGNLPSIDTVEKTMLDLNVCNAGSTVHRRAQSVLGWLRWIVATADDED
jgi:hypothetical protein